MAPPILVAGLDGRSLLLEAPLLGREGHDVEERASGRDLLEAVAAGGSGRLVVLGPKLSDLGLPEAVRRLRASPLTRHVSVLVLVPASEPESLDVAMIEAGANAVLRRPLEGQRLESWLAKLLAVPRRVEARVPVQGQVVGTPRDQSLGHFYGLTRNLSVNGMLLASPVRLSDRPDVELEFGLPEESTLLRALGRVVREAGDVAWPYLGYGVEFLFIPGESVDRISALVDRTQRQPARPAAPDIHSTIRREFWVYEILEPAQEPEGWHAEIRRASREGWRPGGAGPFYVVLGSSREDALAQARGFVLRHG